MADLSITAANVLASASGNSQKGIAGVALTAGQVVYLDASSPPVLQLTDANAAGKQKYSGITQNGAAAGQPVNYVITDPALVVGATLAVGTVYVASATPGAICPSTDLASGMTAIVLGTALTTTTLQLAPIPPTTGAVVP